MDTPDSAEQLNLFGDVAPIPNSRRKGRAGANRSAPSHPAKWPNHEQFPYNDTRSGRTVEEHVLDDLKRSQDPLIVTGYASLDKIVEFLAGYDHNDERLNSLRILLGHEPNRTQRKEYRLRHHIAFDKDIEEYWINHGISLYRSAEVLTALRVLELEKIAIRISANPHQPVHAKIYKGDYAITLGSSNFSKNGMQQQIEANERHQRHEGARYDEACQFAEKVWSLGADYKAGLCKLLRELLCEVTWEEAIARACAELLDGKWARRYITVEYDSTGPAPWPSQQQGVAQAMWIIENVGSVLIADATGSGKTRLGAQVVQAVVNRVWGSGRMRNPMPVVVAPPKMLDDWYKASRQAGQMIERCSYGQLSRDDDDTTVIEALQQAQVLAIDEAHNFLNIKSRRTKTLMRNLADHVILLTATPINRDLSDMLTMINLLGPDNFDDDVLDLLETMLQPYKRRRHPPGKVPQRKKGQPLDPQDLAFLQRELQKFTLRRTKTQFNQMIAEEPDHYRNRLGRSCHYPTSIARFYPTGETMGDVSLAWSIRAAAEYLRGMSYIKQMLNLPNSRAWRTRPNAEQNYLSFVLKGAQGLAVHNVMASLRSSRAALLEHIYGTDAAWGHLDLGTELKAKSTGNMLGRLQKLAGQVPQNLLQTVEIPIWLIDRDEHARACEQERETYELIGRFARSISEAREQTKARLLMGLLQRHCLVLAFDYRLITLYDLAQRLRTQPGIQVVVATGDQEKGCQEVLRLFQLGSDASGIVALCSDSMTEGVNLQAASALVHLDLPTVIRRLEQRDGRINRMDSDHNEIEAWLPADSPAFAPRSDERLYERHRLVADLLGSNVAMPFKLTDDDDEESVPAEAVITPDVVVKGLAAAQQRMDSLPDAFSPVRSLVMGDRAIVPAETYRHYRTTRTRVISSVSVVEATRPWVFLAIAGTEMGAPRFVYLDDDLPVPQTDLEQVCGQLRDRLGPTIPSRRFDNLAADLLNRFLDRLTMDEELLLSRKKQRALTELRFVLNQYRKGHARTRRAKGKQTSDVQQEETNVETAESLERTAVIEAILSLAESPGPRPNEEGTDRVAVDLGILAERWIQIVRPVWYQCMQDSPRKFILLNHLRGPLLESPLSTEALKTILQTESLWIRPLDERIVATIIGVVDPA